MCIYEIKMIFQNFINIVLVYIVKIKDMYNFKIISIKLKVKNHLIYIKINL